VTTEVVGMVQVLMPLHLVLADYRDQSAIAQCMQRNDMLLASTTGITSIVWNDSSQPLLLVRHTKL